MDLEQKQPIHRYKDWTPLDEGYMSKKYRAQPKTRCSQSWGSILDWTCCAIFSALLLGWLGSTFYLLKPVVKDVWSWAETNGTLEGFLNGSSSDASNLTSLTSDNILQSGSLRNASLTAWKDILGPPDVVFGANRNTCVLLAIIIVLALGLSLLLVSTVHVSACCFSRKPEKRLIKPYRCCHNRLELIFHSTMLVALGLQVLLVYYLYKNQWYNAVYILGGVSVLSDILIYAIVVWRNLVNVSDTMFEYTEVSVGKRAMPYTALFATYTVLALIIIPFGFFYGLGLAVAWEQFGKGKDVGACFHNELSCDWTSFKWLAGYTLGSLIFSVWWSEFIKMSTRYCIADYYNAWYYNDWYVNDWHHDRRTNSRKRCRGCLEYFLAVPAITTAALLVPAAETFNTLTEPINLFLPIRDEKVTPGEIAKRLRDQCFTLGYDASERVRDKKTEMQALRKAAWEKRYRRQRDGSRLHDRNGDRGPNNLELSTPYPQNSYEPQPTFHEPGGRPQPTGTHGRDGDEEQDPNDPAETTELDTQEETTLDDGGCCEGIADCDCDLGLGDLCSGLECPGGDCGGCGGDCGGGDCGEGGIALILLIPVAIVAVIMLAIAAVFVVVFLWVSGFLLWVLMVIIATVRIPLAWFNRFALIRKQRADRRRTNGQSVSVRPSFARSTYHARYIMYLQTDTESLAEDTIVHLMYIIFGLIVACAIGILTFIWLVENQPKTQSEDTWLTTAVVVIAWLYGLQICNIITTPLGTATDAVLLGLAVNSDKFGTHLAEEGDFHDAAFKRELLLKHTFLENPKNERHGCRLLGNRWATWWRANWTYASQDAVKQQLIDQNVIYDSLYSDAEGYKKEHANNHDYKGTFVDLFNRMLFLIIKCGKRPPRREGVLPSSNEPDHDSGYQASGAWSRGQRVDDIMMTEQRRGQEQSSLQEQYRAQRPLGQSGSYSQHGTRH